MIKLCFPPPFPYFPPFKFKNLKLNSFFFFSSLRRNQHETTSDSDSEADGQFWRYQSHPTPPQPQPPDSTMMEKSEIATLTKQNQGLDTRRGQLNLPNIIADRSLFGRFSVKDKRLIGSQLLPHNPTKVRLNCTVLDCLD